MPQNRRLRLGIALAAALVAGAAGIFWWLNSSQETEIVFPGMAQASETAISFRTPGRIEQMLVAPGQQVEAGTAVARFNLGDLPARRQRALEAYTASSELLARAEKAAEAQPGGKTAQIEQELSQARQELAEARKLLDTLEAEMAGSVAVTPAAGVIARLVAGRDAVVAAGEPVATLNDPTKAVVWAFLPAAHFGSLAAGDAVTVSPEGKENAFSGTVTAIGDMPQMPPEDLTPGASVQQPAYPVEIQIQGEGLTPGSKVTVRKLPKR